MNLVMLVVKNSIYISEMCTTVDLNVGAPDKLYSIKLLFAWTKLQSTMIDVVATNNYRNKHLQTTIQFLPRRQVQKSNLNKSILGEMGTFRFVLAENWMIYKKYYTLAVDKL